MKHNNQSAILKSDIRRSFDKAANSYDDAAFLQREVADRLLERLDYVRIQPKLILDLGAGTGYATQQLERRYKKAKVIAFDLAANMLLKSKQPSRWFDRKRYICGDVEKLPFQDQAFDFIYSNLMLHWCHDMPAAIKEIRRVLKPNGLFLFSTLGPDTLFELRESWASIDNKPHVHSFIDMHLVGDCLQATQFSEPVMDMEFITLTYNDIKKILLDLKDLGTHNIDSNRLKGLTGKNKFDQFVKAYEQFRNAEGFIPITYEVIYGLGWGSAKVPQNQEINIPITSIGKLK